MTSCRIPAIVAFCVLLGGCADRAPDESPDGFMEIDAPVASPSGQPRFAATADGLLMSWVETSDGIAALRYAWNRGGEWSEPRTAATGDDWFVNWADTPGVVPLADGRLLAFFLQRTGDQPYAYGVRVVMSDDGEDWSEPVIPHAGRFPTEYGFVSVVPMEDGSARLFWLDGTAMYDPESDAGHGHGHGPGAMAIKTAAIEPTGEVRDELLLDDRTCECCPTTAVAVGDEAIVAYRDRSMEEVRDIAVVRVSATEAAPPVVPQPDGWTIAGCPVNGPSADARGDRVALAWFSGADGGQVRLAVSVDRGESFDDVVRIDEGAAVGRVSTAFTDDGSVLVAWLEANRLLVRRKDASGRLHASVAIADVAPDRATGMPQLAVVDDYVWAAWVDVDSRTVRVARGRVGDIP